MTQKVRKNINELYKWIIRIARNTSPNEEAAKISVNNEVSMA
jgi:hypothetical protein